MLKINLLPPYIHEGARRRTAFLVWCVLVIVAAVCVAGFRVTLDKQGDDWVRQAEEAKPEAVRALDFAAKTENVKGQSAATVGKATFVADARKYNLTTYPPVVKNVIDYTIGSVLYSSFAPQGNQVSLSAFAPTLQDVGDYMMWMEHNPEISNVAISLNSVPGFPVPDEWYEAEKAAKENPGQGGHPFGVVLTLLKPLAGGPMYPSAGAAAAPAAGGFGAAAGPAAGAMGGRAPMGGAGRGRGLSGSQRRGED